MYQYNMVTGEPDYRSPNDNFGMISEQEVIQNANLIGGSQPGGGYYYDTQSRMNSIYQPNYQPQSGFGAYMNSPQPGTYGYAGNPAFQIMQNMGYQNVYQDQVYHQPGFSLSGPLLLPEDAFQRCEQLQIQMMMEQEEAYQERLKRQREYMNRTGMQTNYYGTPFMVVQEDYQITNKYRQIIEEMRQEAMDARMTLNKNLSRLSHRYLYGTEPDERQIDEIYEGRTITIPAADVEFNRHQQMLQSAQPVNNAYMYNMHYEQVTNDHNRYFENGNANMYTYFENVGEMMMDDVLAKEKEKRRDGSTLYQQDGSYRDLLRRKMIERKMMNSGDIGGVVEGGKMFGIPNIDISSFPVLSSAGTMLDDHTLMVSAPTAFANKNSQQLVIQNELEQNYEANRGRFIQSIYRDDPIPGGAG